MTNKTATFADIRVGSVIKCNDPRYGWTVRVEAVEENWNGHCVVIYPRGDSGRRGKVAFDRIFTDGKTRVQGYNLLTGVEPQPPVAA